MTTYRIVYSKRSRADLVDIYYGYASLSKKVAKDQVDRIRNEIRSLDTMPERYSIADWEPLQSLKIRRFSVKNDVVFYHVNNEKLVVTVMRIICGRRDMNAIDWTF